MCNSWKLHSHRYQLFDVVHTSMCPTTSSRLTVYCQCALCHHFFSIFQSRDIVTDNHILLPCSHIPLSTPSPTALLILNHNPLPSRSLFQYSVVSSTIANFLTYSI
mmetsp:Transcript_10531/g.14531  ORF Transcript_10531/g.14531 Transcript_10531/m.14531 type:complete len:106 (+) Transcript_10531:603-920(+)